MHAISDREVMNCLTIDIEGFVEANLDSFPIAEKYRDKKGENYEIEKNTYFLLDLLSELGIKGTFFFLGRIARDIPSLIRTAAQAGHEIGCHSYDHVRIYSMGKDDFKRQVTLAKKYLEDASGNPVYGFRAPDFSITQASIWALDILKEVGFFYDSSIYPIGLHDVYGIKEIDSSIHTLPNGLIEVPLSSIEFFGKRFPFGGGGYFRLYPLYLTKLFIRKNNNLGRPCIFYIHPYEIGPIIPKISELSYYRKFRHYYNCCKGSRRLKEILQRFEFGTIVDILKQRDLIEE